MKLRTIFEILFAIPAAIKASAEEELNRRMEGL